MPTTKEQFNFLQNLVEKLEEKTPNDPKIAIHFWVYGNLQYFNAVMLHKDTFGEVQMVNRTKNP